MITISNLIDDMAKASNQPLQPNPFTTYRDPKTGLWLVIKETPVASNLSVIESKDNCQEKGWRST